MNRNKHLDNLLNKYNYKESKYISNSEIDIYFKDNIDDIYFQAFQEIKNYFFNTLGVSRIIFKSWDERLKTKAGSESFNTLVESMQLRRYSGAAIKNYLYALKLTDEWLNNNNNKSLNTAEAKDIKVLTKGKPPHDYVFNSNYKKASMGSKKLSTRTVQKVFNNALKKSGIKKRVSPHDLRHSFAAHLLESGVDIRYIQQLLGHKNLAATSIYTKVSNPKIKSIKSPL